MYFIFAFSEICYGSKVWFFDFVLLSWFNSYLQSDKFTRITIGALIQCIRSRVGLFLWHLSDSIDCFVTTKHYRPLSSKLTHFNISRYFRIQTLSNTSSYHQHKTIGFSHWLKSVLIWLENLTLWYAGWCIYQFLSNVIINMVETWSRNLVHR